MRVKNWKFFYKKGLRRSVKENIVDTISVWCSVGLLWYAAVSMVKEKFPDLIETAILSTTEGVLIPGSNYRLMQMEWGFILPWLFVLWMSSDWVKAYLKKWSLLFSLAGIVMPILYVYMNADKLLLGAAAIGQEYLLQWNHYYDTAFFIASGNIAYAPMAMGVILVGLWWFLWNIAYITKKRVLLGLFPITILVLELVVGLSPVGTGLVCLFFAILLLVNFGGTDIGKKAVVMIGAAGCLMLCNICFADSIDSLTTKEKKQCVLDWQESVLSMDLSMDLAKMLSVDFHFSKETLGNHTPMYTGEVILEIESDTYPTTSLYLKGFHGTDYKNGIWTYDDSAFKEMCQKYGCTEEEMAEYLLDMPYDAVMSHFGEDNILISKGEYVIHYVGSAGDVAYVPYFSQQDSLDEGYTWIGDYLLKKSVWEDTLSVSAIQSDINTETLKRLSPYGQGPKADRFNELASVYCVNQEEFAFFDEAVQKIKGTEEDKLVDSVSGRNAQKLEFAQRVRNYLSDKMSYSLILDDLPYGADPIEYALTQGHEGYCMHFASAGALLLRELGVPARYVSGYVVNPEDFKVVEEGYTAEVTDYAAHAWVEIYLENIGWIPYEMTPGYSAGEEIPTEGDMEEYEKQSEERREEIEEVESESESGSQETEQEESEKDSQLAAESEIKDESEETESEDSTEDVAINAGNNKDGDSTDGTDDAENHFQWNEDVLKGFLGVLCFVIVAIGGYLGLRKFIFKYENSLYLKVKKNMTRTAVKHINKRMFRMLRLKCAKSPEKNLQKGYWTDIRMEEALIASYPSVDQKAWERYMAIVKKMHYSLEDISTEEMQHCYKCYKKVWELTICKQMSGMIQGNYKK